MKKFNFFSLMIAALVMGLSFNSCEEDESLLATDDEDEENKISVTEGALGDSASTTVYVSDLEEGAEEVDVTVKFSSEEGKMRRLYMTKEVPGGGSQKYELDIEGLEKKGDGSVDLSGASEKYGFTFSIPFPISDEIIGGEVTFKVWATSGRGDYRDSEKRLVAGPGTITINYGGDNPDNVEVAEYTAKLLAAPLADGTSETFISVMDGKIYPLSDGEEYAAFWDFGYYWLNSDEASLASSYDYPALFDHDGDEGTPLVAIAELTGTPQEELNKCYFAESSFTEDDFDAITTSDELSDLAVSSSDSQDINHVEVGQVIEFEDDYGKKGLIKVLSIETGYVGEIEIDIKVQP